MIHHACSNCEALQAEVDYLRKLTSPDLATERVARVQQSMGVHLSPYEARVLLVLHERRGGIVSRELLDLRTPALNGQRNDDKMFDVLICRLRRKFSADAIQTVWGQGYRLAPAMVERIDHLLAHRVAA